MNALHDDTERLCSALSKLEPREARLLELRLLQDKTDAEVAAFYGMPKESYRVHLLRAARAFVAAPERNVPLEVELNEGDALERALCGTGAPSPSVAELARALQRLQAHGPEVKALLERRAKAEAESPAAKRETVIRRVLVIILVVVTLYLYFSRPPF